MNRHCYQVYVPITTKQPHFALIKLKERRTAGVKVYEYRLTACACVGCQQRVGRARQERTFCSHCSGLGLSFSKFGRIPRNLSRELAYAGALLVSCDREMRRPFAMGALWSIDRLARPPAITAIGFQSLFSNDEVFCSGYCDLACT